MKRDGLNIVEILSNESNRLTKSENRIADFVLNNMVEAQYMSISELATNSNVSDATVTRFCKTLGFNGFNQFKLQLAKTVSELNRKEVEEANSFHENAVNRIAKSEFNSAIRSLEQTIDFVDVEQYEKAVQLLIGSQNIYCMGQGSSMVMAAEAYSLFLTISNKFSYVTDSHFQAMTASHLKSSDTILYFSFSASTSELSEVLNIISRNNSKLVLITRYPENVLASKADVVLQCGSDESTLRTGSAEARISQIFVLNILFELYFRENENEAVQSRMRTAEAIVDKLL